MTSPLPLCAVTRSTVLALAMVGLAPTADAQTLLPSQTVALARSATTVPAAQSASPQSSPQSKTGFRWDDHPALVLGENTRIAFRARFGFVDRTSDAPLPDDEDRTLDLARKRIGVEGVIAGLFGFQVERELEEDDPWRDVYLNYQ